MPPETINLAIKFSYAGKKYHGNALQGEINTISYQLIKVLKKLEIYISDPILYGRTDKGVNAKNMVCNFLVKKLNKCHYADFLNWYLPDDIIVRSYAVMPKEFNARFNCVQRHYRYYFYNYNCKMEEICEKIKMMTDFKSLCKSEENTKRTIDELYIEKIKILRDQDGNDINDVCFLNCDGIHIETCYANEGLVNKDENSIKDVCYTNFEENYNKNCCSNENECKLNDKNSESHISDDTCDSQENIEYKYNKQKENIGIEYTKNLLDNKQQIIKNNRNRIIYVLNVKAKGFLYHMVRKIFWVLENAHLDIINEILENKTVAGTSKADGLVFCCAKYDFEIPWIDANRKVDENNWYVQKEIERFLNDF